MKYVNFRKTILCILILLFVTQAVGCGNQSSPNALEDMALIDIINAMYEIKTPELSLHQEVIELKDQNAITAYSGLDSTDNIKEIAYSEPMIGSQAYSLVLIRVKDESKVGETASEMKSNVNPAKWICVMADDLQIVSYRDVIMLFMVSSELSDVITSKEMIASFREVCGEDLITY